MLEAEFLVSYFLVSGVSCCCSRIKNSRNQVSDYRAESSHSRAGECPSQRGKILLNKKVILLLYTYTYLTKLKQKSCIRHKNEVYSKFSARTRYVAAKMKCIRKSAYVPGK